MMALAISSATVRDRLEFTARIFAILTAVSIPWSSSATSICAGIWLLTLLPTIKWTSLRSIANAPAAYMPIALVVLAIIGMLWADVMWSERMQGLAPFVKLLVIPLLMFQFSSREGGKLVLLGFLISATVLLVLSWLFAAMPQLPLATQNKGYGIPVKDYISQSGIFTLCAFALLERALAEWKRSRGMAILLAIFACVFFANIIFVALARTFLVVIVLLFVLLGVLRMTFRGFAVLTAVGVVCAAISWSASGYLRDRVTDVISEINTFSPAHDTSSGARLSFWKDSIAILQDAPVLGHGTGSIREMFSRQAGEAMNAPGAASNPHNQTFAVAIQLGTIGALVLFMMWIAHVKLFLAQDMISWIGLIVVAQNIVGSLFNSHLFDFTQGWIYVFGVGVTGGLMLRQSAITVREASAPAVVS
jgi:O-antigen ligase